MSLATLDDINHFLPQDKITLTDPADDAYQLDAERIIKGYLSNTFSATTLAGWSDPTITNQAFAGYVPSLIRGIAGRFIASFFYATKFAGETTDTPQYSQKLYDEGWDFLRKIASGEMVLSDEDAETPDTGMRLTEDDFFPNDPNDQPPKFSMSLEL